MQNKLNYSNEEQLELVRDYQKTDSQFAFKQLYEMYAGVRNSYANKYKFKGLSKEDLLSICETTFVDCVQKFNPDHEKVKTGSMSLEYWVKLETGRAIKHALSVEGMHPEIGKVDYEMLNKINIVWQQLIEEAEPGEKVTLADVADNLEMPLYIIQRLLKIVEYAKNPKCSLDFEIGDNLKFMDVISTDDSTSVYTSSNIDSFKEKKPEMVESMSRSQSATIVLLHGDDDIAQMIFERQIMTNPALRSEVIASYGDIEGDEIPPSLKKELNHFFNNVIRECKKPMPYILRKNLGLIIT